MMASVAFRAPHAAARHRRIDELDTALRIQRRDAPRRRRRDGGKVDVDRARHQAFDELRREPFDIAAGGDVGADDFARGRHLRRHGATPRTALHQKIGAGGTAAPDMEGMPGLQQMSGHRRPHGAETDEADVHGRSALRIIRPCRSSFPAA
jgi:hypothetical protein